ncbi:MAG: RNA polymerase sigma factor [Myxococcota bacterium]
MRKLLEGLAPIILGTTRQILGQREDAEDAAQEAMVDLARSIDALREPEAVVAFARRLTTRVALRHRAKRTKYGERAAGLADDDATVAHVEPSFGIAEQQAERLRDHIARLPENQAVALVMQHMLGYRPAEVAQATGVSVNTVRSRVRLAREALTRSLAEDGAFDEARKSEAS